MKARQRTISLQLLVIVSVSCSMLFLSALLVYQGFRGTEKGLVSATAVTAKHLSNTANFSILATLSPSTMSLRMLSQDNLANAETLKERLSSLPMLTEALRSNNLFSAIYAGYTSGEFFLVRRYTPAHPLITEPAPPRSSIMVQAVSLQPDGSMTGNILFYDAGLTLLEDRSLPTYTFDPRTRSWFQLAAASADIEITSPYVFFTSQEIGVTMALQAANGNAVFGIDATARDLSTLLENLRLSPHAEIAIMDTDGKLIAYPDVKRLILQDGKDLALASLKSLNLPILNQLAASDTLITDGVRLNDGTQDWFGFKQPVSAFGSGDLTMLIAIPSRELLADAWANAVTQGMIAAGISLVLIILGVIVSRQIIMPLKHLTRQVGALEEFDFSRPIGVNTIVREVRDLGKILGNMAHAISSFQSISLTLNKEQNLERMLASVLEQLLSIVHMKCGTVFLLDESGLKLTAFVSQGDQLAHTIDLPSGSLNDTELHALLAQSPLGTDVLVALRNRENDLVGLLALSGEEEQQNIARHKINLFAHKIAGSAAVAIETRQLIHAQKALLDSIIKLVADAIDTKSQYTGGHCQRVPILAMMLMDSICASTDPVFGGYAMNNVQKEEFRIAAWLHDCGKITTPEYVVDKATKLETIYNRIHEVRMRFELLHRDALIKYFEAVAAGEDPQAARAACLEEQKNLQDDFAFVAKCNIGGEAMQDADITRLQNIASRVWMRYFDDRIGLSRDELLRTPAHAEATPLPAPETLLADKQSHIIPWGDRIPPVQPSDQRNTWGFNMKLPSCMYNYGEVYNLSIRRGTLSEEERFKINDHIVQTICMLSSLPLPKVMKNIPSIAGNHHEKIDGTGYPRRIKGEDMTIAERVMVLADIFEALTASDRPYKDGKTLSQSLALLSKMAKEQHVDISIFNHFVRSGVYLEYAQSFLKEKQIDEVQVEKYLINREQPGA